jgi:hypothetical protein
MMLWRSRDIADLNRLGQHRVIVLKKPLESESLLNAAAALIGAASRKQQKDGAMKMMAYCSTTKVQDGGDSVKLTCGPSCRQHD